MDQLKPFLAKADQYLSKCTPLVDIEKKTSIPKVYLVASLWIVISASLFTNVLAGFTFSLIALLYPGYKTLEAIQKNDPKLKLWTFYFLLLNVFSFIELFDFIVELVPFYMVFKTAFVVWLTVPPYFGLLTVYDTVTPPIFTLLKSQVYASSKKE